MRTRRPPAAPDGRMSIWEHLAELRSRIIKSVLAIAVGAAVVFVLFDPLMGFLIGPYRDLTRSAELPDGKDLIFTSPMEAFSVRIRVSLYGGIILAAPVLAWHLWRFVTPGLHPREKRYAVPFVAASAVLFAMGATLAWYTVPRALQFLVNIGGENLEELFRAEEYLSLIVLMILAFGISFEFPLLLFFLLLARVVTTATLRRFRRHTIVGIALFVALITPSGDPFTLMVLSVPLYLFFEIVLLVGRILKR